jgi:hypothetical protein
MIISVPSIDVFVDGPGTSGELVDLGLTKPREPNVPTPPIRSLPLCVLSTCFALLLDELCRVLDELLPAAPVQRGVVVDDSRDEVRCAGYGFKQRPTLSVNASQ